MLICFFFFFNDTATTEIYTLSLHDALPISVNAGPRQVDSDTPTRTTLLVVDDEEMVRRLAARMLVMLGYRVLEARSGQEAVRLLRRGAHRIDAVLTDVAMPGIGGRELGETIARCWPQIRVLYMSGFAVNRMVSEGALDPSVPFIQKPFTSEQLGRREIGRAHV